MSPIAGSMMENAMLFFTFEQAKLFLTHNSGGEFTLTHVAQAGALAGLGTTLVLTPVGSFLCCRRLLFDRSTSAKNRAVIRKGIEN